MKIWHLKYDSEKYDSFFPADPSTLGIILSFDGRSQKSAWRPFYVERAKPEKRLPLSDIPNFLVGVPTFSERALEALYPIIEDSVEILDICFSEGKYYLVNVTRVIDVIDYDLSNFVRFSTNQRIMKFNKYAFKQSEALQKSNIFKIIDAPKDRAFVSDLFKKTVEMNGLTGFIFQEVWDSDQSGTGDGSLSHEENDN